MSYGARSLRRSPGFALTAIAVLALGIGANLAEFHIFEAVLHRLNVHDPDSLCQFRRMTRQLSAPGLSIPEIEFYRRHNSVLSAVISETEVPGFHQAEDSAELRFMLVSGNFFGELGILPQYGRLLDEQDDKPGAPPAAVLTYTYWRNRFGSDPGIVTKTIRLNDKPVQVVGIGPPQFGGLGWQVNVWMAASQYPYLTGDDALQRDFGMRNSGMFGRLKPGISLAAAQEEFRSLTAELRREQPEYLEEGEWLNVLPADGQRSYTPTVILLLSTVIVLVLLVLFSACANLGNMLLARGFARQREIEIRLAIGAGRWRLIRQLMTESLLLAAMGSVAALFVGRTAAVVLLRVMGAPSDMRIATDWRIVLAAAALALGATLAFGLAPAVQAVKGGPRATRARRILVCIQVASSCVLLILSTFFARAIQQSFHTELSFDASRTAVVDPRFMHRYSPAQSRQAAQDLAARLRQLPGVGAASIVTVPPLLRKEIEHYSGVELYMNSVEASYFPMMNLPLVAGRLFGAADPDAIVISESAARRLWPNRSPLGESLVIQRRARTVIGVVKDSGVNLLTMPESVEAYTPIDDAGTAYPTVLVHATGNAARIAGALRGAATNPGVISLVFTLQGLIDQQLESIRKMVMVVGSLAAIASLLALLGIFGMLAFTVAQRTREIGVRMALGARGADILRVVLGQYTFPFGAGAAAGVVVAAGAAKVFRSLVYGFIPFDPLSFGAGLLLFAAVALVASIAPVRRALRIDPVSALRYE